jgi:hypothetical protein
VELANAVDRLDSIFILDNQDPGVPAPSYLDELWQLLDWCDASWQLDGNSPLETELERIRDAIAVGLAEMP